MEVFNGAYCDVLFLDVICYELTCGRLSPEMEYIFEKHLEVCPECRKKVATFNYIMREGKHLRNLG